MSVSAGIDKRKKQRKPQENQSRCDHRRPPVRQRQQAAVDEHGHQRCENLSGQRIRHDQFKDAVGIERHKMRTGQGKSTKDKQSEILAAEIVLPRIIEGRIDCYET